jgi:Kef-type K+ transport system membrane component KefB
VPVFLAVSGLATDFAALQAGDVPLLLLFVAAGVLGKWGGGRCSSAPAG